MKAQSIFGLWLPLAISFAFMMLEGPVAQAVIAHLPNAALSLAAFGVVMSIAITIESPVIMLLSTSIALARDGQSFRVLGLFVFALVGLLTALTGLVAYTPLYELVALRLLGLPNDVAAAARPALGLMLFWTAAIGTRRFYQGVLVRFGHSRLLSISTAIRLSTICALGAAALFWRGLPGTLFGAGALMTGVLAETLATYLFARPVVRTNLRARNPELPPLRFAEVLRFHTPLAATSVLTLLVMPITNAALARLDAPAVSLAAWPVIFSLLLVLRSAGLVMQEVTVALAQSDVPPPALRRFTLLVTLGVTAITALLVFTPLLDGYLYGLAGIPHDIGDEVTLGMRLGLLVPGLTALISWQRGVLVGRGDTAEVNWAMITNVVVMVLALIGGVWLGAPGVPLAALALTLALLVEMALLARVSARFARLGERSLRSLG